MLCNTNTNRVHHMSKYSLIAGAFSLSIATVVVMIVESDRANVRQDPFDGLHLSAPSIEDIADDDIRLSPTVRYQSDTHGYVLRYPASWSLENATKDFDGDILADPSERAVITINETVDDILVGTGAVDMVTDSITSSLRLDPAFRLTTLKQLQWKGHITIFTNGTRHLGSKVLHTQEYTIFRPQRNGVLTLSITTEEKTEILYQHVIESILNSLEVTMETSL